MQISADRLYGIREQEACPRHFTLLLEYSVDHSDYDSPTTVLHGQFRVSPTRMMRFTSAEFFRVFCGGVFTFIVEHQPIIAHEALIARTSRPFRAMMRNGMRETTEKQATLWDVDKATFVRFVEWAYTGDYNNKGSELGTQSELTPHPSTASENWRAACRRPLPTCSVVHFQASIDVFWDHLRLYLFADKYSVLQLQSLVVDRLWHNLLQYGSDSLGPHEVQQLVCDIYEKSEDAALRKVICQYLAREYKYLVQSTEFIEFWNRGGQHIDDANLILKDWETKRSEDNLKDLLSLEQEQKSL